MFKRALALAAAVALSACGGDSTGPDNPFPDASGSYALDGGFDGLTRSDASFSGSVTLTQASQTSGTLGGTMTVTLTVGGDVSTVTDVAIQSASVTPTGVVSFRLGSSAAGSSWTFSGTRAGKVITGRHTLASSDGTFSGDWTGTSP